MGLSLTQGYNKNKTIVYPHFIYYKKGFNRRKISCHIQCFINDWNTKLHRVERGRKGNEYKLKNLTIQNVRNKLEGIINRYKNNDELLTPSQLLLELKKREKVKQAKSYSSLPLLTLIQEWENEYSSNNGLAQSTKAKGTSVIKDIKDYIIEVETSQSNSLLIDDMDKIFLTNFMNWLFIKKTKRVNGLQPHTVSRRFKFLQSFCVWYSKNSKEYTTIDIPYGVSKANEVSEAKMPLCFYQKELETIYNFTEFNFLEQEKINESKSEWVESDKWQKYLSRDKQNREKKNGVVEFVYEDTKDGKQTYTSWEVYKDFLVFLCSVGCRYGDGVEMKLSHMKHAKRSKNSMLKDGVEGFFKYYQRKTHHLATPRINTISYEIYRKYSRGKTNDDYLFPRAISGNGMSDQKFNKHIKQICRTLKLNRKIETRSIGAKGVELSKVQIPLWEKVSSHIGRKTYIKTMVLSKTFNTREIMKMTGHKTDKIFHKYYSIEDRDLLSIKDTGFNNFVIEDDIKVNKIDVELEPLPQKKELTIKEKIGQLKELRDIDEITQKKFQQLKEKLLNEL